jgi:hypothetical protein
MFTEKRHQQEHHVTQAEAWESDPSSHGLTALQVLTTAQKKFKHFSKTIINETKSNKKIAKILLNLLCFFEKSKK